MPHKYTALIVEDDPVTVEQLIRILEQTDLFTAPFVCSTSAQALATLYEHSFDILFLDIELPDTSAFEFLRMSSNHPPVCAISYHPAYAVNCYDLGIEDFIVKPLAYPRVLRSVGRILRNKFSQQEAPGLQPTSWPISKLPDYIYLKNGRQTERFAIDEILYMESYHIYTKLFTATKFTVISEKISVLEERLTAYNFIRIHKSFLVNLAKVTNFNANTIWVNTLKLPIGGVYKAKLQERLKAVVTR